MIANIKADPELSWSVHPLRRNWVSSVLTIMFLCTLGVIVYRNYGLLLAVLSIVILFGSLSSFFFPTRYAIYSDRIEIKTPVRRYSREWSYFKSYYPYDNGVLLSPFPDRSRLERFRGVYILTCENHGKVIDTIKSKLRDQRGDDQPSKSSQKSV